MLDVWFGFNIHTLFLFIWYVIHLLSLFVWGSLGPRLMMFSMHCISCMRGMGIVRIFKPSVLSFLSPYYLSQRYVSCLKTTLRPWLHTLCITTHTWAILEIGWRLFLRAWWIRRYDMIYTGAYPSYQWWIFGGDVIYTRAYPTHQWQFLLGWCLALGHS